MPRVDLDLSDEHRLFRDTVRGFAEGVVAPVAEELDAQGRFPLAELGQAAELGLLGIPIAEADGGAGGDTLAYAICIEELARIDSSFAITVAAHTSLGTMPINLFGDERQRAEWLPQLASGERLAAFLGRPRLQELPAVLETAGHEGKGPDARCMQELERLWRLGVGS